MLVLILDVSKMNHYHFRTAILFSQIILLVLIQSVLLMQSTPMTSANAVLLLDMLLCLLGVLLLGDPRLSLLLLLVLLKLSFMLLFLLPKCVSLFATFSPASTNHRLVLLSSMRTTKPSSMLSMHVTLRNALDILKHHTFESRTGGNKMLSS